MKSLFCFGVRFSQENFHRQGVYIFRISVFCFSVVNIYFKPTIFSEDLIIQVWKLVASCHLSFLAHQNSPLQLRMAISATPVEGSRQEKFHCWSSVWAAGKATLVPPTPVVAPPLSLGPTFCNTPSVGRGWWYWVSAPVRGNYIPFLHRDSDWTFQSNTQVTGSVCAIYKYVRCYGTVLWMMRFLDFPGIPFIPWFYSLASSGRVCSKAMPGIEVGPVRGLDWGVPGWGRHGWVRFREDAGGRKGRYQLAQKMLWDTNIIFCTHLFTHSANIYWLIGGEPWSLALLGKGRDE